MKNLRLGHILVVAVIFQLQGVCSHREEDCVEVGFARASYLNVDNGYQAAKQKLIPIWKEEDLTGKPSFRLFTEQTKNITRAAQLLEETSKNVIAIIRKTRVGKRCEPEWLLHGVEKHVQPLIQLDKELAEDLGLVMSFRCLVGSPYANVDGTCINEQGPDMGANGGKFLRLMPPFPGKGGFTLRGSVNREKALPSAREVANLIRRRMPEDPTSSLFKEYSEFIAADTFSIPSDPYLEGVDCCDDSEKEREDCDPIPVGSGDPLYSKLKCINYWKSSKAQAILGHRESLSLVSTYFDATPVYGSTNEIAFNRKTGYFGYMKIPDSMDADDAAESKSSTSNCEFPKSFDGCFVGFDKKDQDSNFFEGLRLLLLLEHNRIADGLVELNPHFDDALLYNEARRITIAQYSTILFGEFIPLILGSELTEKHDMKPGSAGPGDHFVPEVNPGILTCFALGAYRNPSVSTFADESNPLSELVGLAHYESIGSHSTKDFLAVDVQRGRDHGLSGYIHWRRFCDPGRVIDNFDDLRPLLVEGAADDLKSLYGEELKDLDILVALLEKPDEDAVVGKTFTCILADQYARLKTGNRLHWEHETSMLTIEQRNAIRNGSSAAGLLCRHFGLEKIARNPFSKSGDDNPDVLCSETSTVDLTPWVDTSLIEVMKKVKEEKELKEKEKLRGGNKEDEGQSEEAEVEVVAEGEDEKVAVDDDKEGGEVTEENLKFGRKIRTEPEDRKKQEL